MCSLINPNPDILRKYVLIFKPHHFTTQYPLERGLCEPKNQSGRNGALDFQKILDTEFYENSSRGSQVVPCGGMDGQT